MAIRFEPKPAAEKPAKPKQPTPAKPVEAPMHSEAAAPSPELPLGKSPPKSKPKRARA